MLGHMHLLSCVSCTPTDLYCTGFEIKGFYPRFIQEQDLKVGHMGFKTPAHDLKSRKVCFCNRSRLGIHEIVWLLGLPILIDSLLGYYSISSLLRNTLLCGASWSESLSWSSASTRSTYKNMVEHRRQGEIPPMYFSLWVDWTWTLQFMAGY